MACIARSRQAVGCKRSPEQKRTKVTKECTFGVHTLDDRLAGRLQLATLCRETYGPADVGVRRPSPNRDVGGQETRGTQGVTECHTLEAFF